jgi:hypothetical protein
MDDANANLFMVHACVCVCIVVRFVCLCDVCMYVLYCIVVRFVCLCDRAVDDDDKENCL